ncbi:MAG: TRAP transporter small permease subunit [Croceibacterium sp.]
MTALHRIGVWIGGAALLAATAIDTIAVIGRNIGLPIIGSIELVQTAVLVSGVFGLIFATWGEEHARVRILTDRLPRAGALADIIGPLSMALFFGCLLTGSLWLASDLWSGHERSEVLGIPWGALRLTANLGLAGCVLASLAVLFRRTQR